MRSKIWKLGSAFSAFTVLTLYNQGYEKDQDTSQNGILEDNNFQIVYFQIMVVICDVM